MARLRALPADSSAARQAIVRANPAGVRLAFDSLLVASRPGNAAEQSFLALVAHDYRAATADSILLRDQAFVPALAADKRRIWMEGVRAEEEAQRLRGQQKHPEAAARFEVAASRYAATGDLRREALALGSLGIAWWSAGDFDAAGKAYQRALEARQRLGDPVLVGRTLNGLGSVAMRQNDYPAALSYYEQARAVRQRIGDRSGLGVTLSYIGNVHYLNGDLVPARASYMQALEVLGDDAKPSDLLPARVGLANVLMALGEYREARAMFERYKTGLPSNMTRELALTQRNLAACLKPLGEYAAALEELRQAADAQVASGDKFELASTRNIEGGVQIELGDPARALEAFRQAETLATEAKNPLELGVAIAGQALAYTQLNYPDRALETYERGRSDAIAREDSAALRSILDGLGQLKTANGAAAEALELHREAMRIDTSKQWNGNLSQDHLQIGNALRCLDDCRAAHPEFRQAVDGSRKSDRRDVLWKANLGLADCFEHMGALDSAQAYNDRALAVLENLRSEDLTEGRAASLVGRSAFVYEAQIQVLAKRAAREPGHDFEAAALEVAERGRARALLDEMQQNQMDLGGALPEALRGERDEVERALNAVQYRLRTSTAQGASADSLAALRKRRTALEEKRAAVLDRIRLQAPQYVTVDAGRPATVAELRQELLRDDSSLLLEYALGDSGSYIWALDSKRIVMRRTAPRATIETRVQELRSGLKDPTPGGDAALLRAAAELGHLLLEPVRSELSGKKRLYVVPDGDLHSMPFEVLLWTAPKESPSPADSTARGKAFARMPWVLRDVEVRYGPSATLLAVLSRGRGRAPQPQVAQLDLLAVGDPTFDPGKKEDTAPAPSTSGSGDGTRAGLAPLPWSGAEVTAIAGLFPADHCTLLRGEAAREATLVQPGYLTRYRWMHFATHGLVDPRRPERSSLALAFPKDESEDGYLQASEIYGLQLDADLVTLSACETGLGRTVRGEGVLGLPRAFLFAGATNVVVSLWSVSDRSTSEFMQEFYRQMQREKRGSAAALRQAREKLRRDPSFAHPFYWAPFVVIGPG